MAHGFITSEETVYLRDIRKLLRILTNHIINSTSDLLDSFIVGSGAPAPANGDTQYANPSLNGVSFIVFKNGVGYLTLGTDYQLLTGGGFELIGGAVFSTDEKYLIFKA